MGNEYKPRHKDVIDYQPYNQWCHEGTAIVEWDNKLKKHRYYDTYWRTDKKEVNEPRGASLMFNLNEVRQVSEYEWDKYADDDRYILSSQHHLQKSFYVRKGASESISKQIEDARIKVEEKRYAVDSAVRDLEWEWKKLAKLELEEAAKKEKKTT